MATNGEVIGDALRSIGVIAEGQSPSAEQGLVGLRKLNELMESWIDEEIDVGWFEQDSTTDDFPLPLAQKRAVTSNLALELAPTYGATVSAELMRQADISYKTLARKIMVDRLEAANMDHLPMGAGHLTTRSNIETDGE